MLATALRLVVSSVVLCLATVSADCTLVQGKAATGLEAGKRWHVQNVILANDLVSYTLRTEYFEDPDQTGRILPKKWAPTMGYTPLGIAAPSMALWYNQGFMHWTFDDLNLRDFQPRMRVIRKFGADAVVEYSWDTPKAKVTMRFGVVQGNDKLVLLARWQPKTEIKTVKLRLQAYPATFSKPHNRRATTALSTRETGSAQLDLAKEKWVLLEDITEDRPSAGSAGLLLGDTTAFSKATLASIGGYAEHVDFVLAPGRTSLALAFYELAEHPDYKQTRTHFRAGGDAESASLAQLLAADWDQPWSLPTGNPERFREILRQRKQRDAEMLARPAEAWTAAKRAPGSFPWFQSIPGGPVRVSLLCPRQAAWETMQLAARLDLDLRHQYFDQATAIVDARSWPYQRQTGVGPLPAGLATRHATEICRDPEAEVILVNHVQGQGMPERVRREILAAVRAGKGLYLAGDAGMLKGWPKGLTATPDDALLDPVLAAFTWESIPGLRPGERGRVDGSPPLRAYRYGKGRVVYWRTKVGRYSSFSPVNDATEGLDGAFDRILALNASALLVAAGRPLPLQMALQAHAPPKQGFRLNWSGPRPDRVHLRVQDDMDRTVFIGDCPPDGFPSMPVFAAGGRYFAEVVALNREGETVGVATTTFAVEQGLRVQSVEITPSRRVHAEAVPMVDLPNGGNVMARITVADAGDVAGVVAEFFVFDAFDRLLAQKAVPLTAAGAQAQLWLGRPVTVCHHLDVALRRGNTVLARARERFTVPLPFAYDDFTYLMWSYARGEPLTRFVQRRCYELGSDLMDLCHMRYAEDAAAAREYAVAARSGLRLVPYVTRVALEARDDHTFRPGLHDQAWFEKQRASMVPCTRQAIPYAPPAYTLGDENYLSRGKAEGGGSPETVAAFRAWLQTKYKTIVALNQTWASDHASFAAITEPLWLAEAALQNRSYAAWFDHREFLDTAFTDLHEQLAGIIRDEHPGAKVGWDGPLRYHWQAGYDFWKWTRNLELNQVYSSHPLQGDLVRSFAKPGTLRGEWGNNVADNEEGFRAIAWFNLFRQHNSCWWWTSWGCDYIPFNPDGSPSTYGEWYFDEARELRAGIGKLLLHAKRDDSGVSILYSQADHFAARLSQELDAKAPQRFWKRNLESSAKFIRQAGLQFRYLDRTQLTADGLAGTKLLVLPLAVCLSDQQVVAIRAYVKAGGTVLADGRVGLLTGNGVIRANRALNDVFGLGLPGGLDAFAHVEPTRGEGETAYQPLEPGEIFTTNRFGEGLAIRSNVSFGQLLNWPKPEDHPDPLVLPAGLRAPASCDPALDEVEQILFLDGGARYLAFQRSIHRRERVTLQSQIHIAKPTFVYDVRNRTLVSPTPTDSWEVTVTRGRPALFALLPYRVASVNATLPGAATRGRALAGTIALQGALGAKVGYHVVHVGVFAPGSDEEHRQYSQNVACPDGQGTFDIPFALSDSPGAWRTVCRDAATGVETTREIQLR
jgi:hypothetical protein